MGKYDHSASIDFYVSDRISMNPFDDYDFKLFKNTFNIISKLRK